MSSEIDRVKAQINGVVKNDLVDFFNTDFDGARRCVARPNAEVAAQLHKRLIDKGLGAISATVLRPGVAHGRYLVGQVVGPPTMMAACRVILREASGELLELFLYNIVHRREEMDQLFREGSTVLVKEPFMKVMGD
jgi:hypothetical protein